MIRIDRVSLFDVRDGEPPGDDTLFVAVHAAGLTGWYGPVSNAIGSYVEQVLAPIAVGADVTDHQALGRRLRRTAMTNANPCAAWAMGAVDCAAWDLHGRLTGLAVAELLNPGSARRPVAAYASWLSQELTGSLGADVVNSVLSGGWSFTKWGLRRKAAGDTGAEAAILADAVHRTAGEAGGRIAVDAVGTWPPPLALAFARRVNPSSLIWLEDPLPRHALRSYARLASSGLPVAIGERLTLREDPATVFRAVSPVAVTLDVVGCGGLTRALSILATAHACGLPVFPHGRSLVPGIHLAAAFPAAVPAVEYRLQWEPGRQHLYSHPWRPHHGHLPLPEAAGLGATPRRTSCRVSL